MTEAKKKEYLTQLFKLVRLQTNMTVISDKKSRFTDTELRLLGEILTASYEGRRLISTRLADLLGITRSAVSQIVNKLEKQGVVRRVPSDMDKKIAYVEISEEALDTYKEEVQNSVEYVGSLVKEFGEDKFNRMYKLIEEFTALAQRKGNGEK